MQAPQSSIASGKESRLEQFAALRRISRRLEGTDDVEGVGPGRARVVTDRATFAYLADVYVYGGESDGGS